MKFFKKLIKYFKKKDNVPLTIFLELFFGLFLSISSLILFIKLANEVLEKEFKLFNKVIMDFIFSFRSESLTTVIKGVTLFGDELVILFVAIISIFLLIKKKKKYAITLILVVFFGAVINYILKGIFKVPRPIQDPILIENYYSFPSGHSMNSFIFYSLIAHFIYIFASKKIYKVLGIIFTITMILLVGISRIYLGVHYPTDVIAGYIAGLWWLTTALLFEKTLGFIKRNKSSINN